MEQLKAVVFARSGDLEPHVARCVQYCGESGYSLLGIVTDDWGVILQMLTDQEAEVVVVATEDHLPPKRKPRIEIVANKVAGTNVRRTRIIKYRNAAK